MGQAVVGADGPAWCSKCAGGASKNEAITLEHPVAIGRHGSTCRGDLEHDPQQTEGSSSSGHVAGRRGSRRIELKAVQPKSEPRPLFARPLVVEGSNERVVVPPGDDLHDTADAEAALKAFAQVLVDGAGMRLAMEGVGMLTVEASLSRDLSTLTLVFNTVVRRIPLVSVRHVHMDTGERQIQGGGRFVHVQLDLEDGQFCTFLFDGGEEGMQEATYFSRCISALVQSVRFEVLKADLDAGPQLLSEAEANRLSTSSFLPTKDEAVDLQSNADAIVSALLALPQIDEDEDLLRDGGEPSPPPPHSTFRAPET